MSDEHPREYAVSEDDLKQLEELLAKAPPQGSCTAESLGGDGHFGVWRLWTTEVGRSVFLFGTRGSEDREQSVAFLKLAMAAVNILPALIAALRAEREMLARFCQDSDAYRAGEEAGQKRLVKLEAALELIAAGRITHFASIRTAREALEGK